jgi:flagellar hook-associated protein 3 FlgL
MSMPGIGPIVITPQVMTQQFIDNLTADQASLAQLENQISSGNAVTVPSDNPSAAANILQLQSAITRANQYATNAQTGVSRLGLANSTVNSILNVLQQVQSAVEGISGASLTGDPAAVAAVAQQVTSAQAQLVNLANTQYAGQAIFSGTGNPQAAYDQNGNYLGAGQAPTTTVAPGTHVAVGVTGPAIFGTGSTGLLGNTSGNMGVLAQIAQDLQTGTPASIEAAQTTGLGNLQAAIGQVEDQAAVLGANQQSMQGFATQATAAVTALTQELGNLQNVDMASAITNLQLQQTAYQAALYATSQLHTLSLTQYL